MNITTTNRRSVRTPQRYPGLVQRTGLQGVTITLAVAVEVEGSLSTESPDRIENVPKTVRRAEGGLQKQEDTGTEGLTEVEKQQSRTELLMAVNGGREEVAISTKWTGRGREHASTEGSKLNLSSEH